MVIMGTADWVATLTYTIISISYLILAMHNGIPAR